VTHLYLLDPIYDLRKLKSLRAGAAVYVHGHLAGGTNPSLVEAMHFGLPLLAFDCDFNRATTENKAFYFRDANELLHLVDMRDEVIFRTNGEAMLEIAQRRYTWEIIAKQYFDLIGSA